MANAKGRAAQSPHPGTTIKEVLMGQKALKTGELSTEVSIKDIYLVYKELIHQENIHRKEVRHPKSQRYKRLRGMTYQAFYSLFRLAKYLRLVEFVRDEPAHLSGGERLYSTRKTENGRVDAVPTTRKVYKLTDKGRADEKSWRNLHKAWENRENMLVN
jgi:hypothetical protein